MKSWAKTFILFLFLAFAFMFNLKDCSVLSMDRTSEQPVQAMIVKPHAEDYFCVSQNHTNTFLSEINNTSDFSWIYAHLAVFNNNENRNLTTNITEVSKKYISHNISPNLEYAIYTRAP